MTTEADRILALAAETTPGPWHLNGAHPANGLGHYWSCQPGGSHIRWDQERYKRDAAFIAEVRTLAPVVAEQVKELEAKVEWGRYANEEWKKEEAMWLDERKALEEKLATVYETMYSYKRSYEIQVARAERSERSKSTRLNSSHWLLSRMPSSA